MEGRNEVVEEARKTYEPPTLVEREDLLQVTEAAVIVSVSGEAVNVT